MPFRVRESRGPRGSARTLLWVPPGAAEEGTDDISSALAGGVDGPKNTTKKWPVIVYLSANESELLPLLEDPMLPPLKTPPGKKPGLLEVLRLYDPSRAPNPLLTQPATNQQAYEMQQLMIQSRKCADLVATSSIVVAPLLGTLVREKYPPMPKAEWEKAVVESLDILLRNLASEHPINAEKVYLVGSGRGAQQGARADGARLAWKLAAAQPWRFAALAVWDLPLWDVDEAAAEMSTGNGNGNGKAATGNGSAKAPQVNAGAPKVPESPLEKECAELRRVPIWIFSSPQQQQAEPDPVPVAPQPKVNRPKLKVTVTKPGTKPKKAAAAATPTKPTILPPLKPPSKPLDIPTEDTSPPPLIETLSSFLTGAVQPSPTSPNTPPTNPITLGSDLAFHTLRSSGATKVLRTLLETKGQNQRGSVETRTEAGSPFVAWDFWRWCFGHSRPRGPGRM